MSLVDNGVTGRTSSVENLTNARSFSLHSGGASFHSSL